MPAVRRSGGKIKILFFIDYLHGFGGTERHLFNLASRLDRNRFECTVCALRYDVKILRQFRKAGIAVEPAPLKRIYGLSALRRAAHLRTFIREHNFDIVQTFNLDSDIYGTLVAHFSNRPLIISSRRDMGAYRRSRHNHVGRLTNRYVDRFLAVCEAVADNMTVSESVAESKITTIYNGFDFATLAEINQDNVAELRSELNLSPESFVVGNVSHFRPEKGHAVFFEAIRKLSREIDDLRVLALGGSAGSGLLQKYKRELSQEGLDDRVFLPGYVENVFDYVSVMDVCCLTPSANEGFSNAILEQMAMGKPVVATDVGGNREAVADGETGFVVPPDDADAIAEALLKFYRDPGMRKQFGENARKRVEQEFSMDRMIARMEAFYGNLYENKQKKSF